jgi:Cys-rich repeat protein
MTGSRLTHWSLCCLSLAFAVAGCSTDTTSNDATGSLSVNLELGDGTVIEQVDWRITGNDMDMAGTINVSAPGSTASVEVFGLPPNDGVGDEKYVVELSAVSEDGEVTCKGSAPFDVEVGKATDVTVMLNCKLPQTLGSVRVNGEFNICAELAKMVVSPLQTSVGNDIDLSALGIDADGDPIQYIWSASGGSIADSNADSTTYTCEEIGVHEITVNVTDNDVYCRMAQWTVAVQCVLGEVECILNRDCDDGQQCTVNGCDEGRCVTVDRDMGDTCDQDDGTVCDGDGNCVEEAECTLAPECNDGMQCTLNNCIAGACTTTDSDPGDTCDEGGGSVCDGSGSCVECVTEAQCSGGDQCNAPACADNLCDIVPDREGLECDLGGAGDGICEEGDCVEPPDCTSPGDCIDGNPCTIGDCNIVGECVFDPNDGASCDIDGAPGTCDGTMCVGLCVGEDCTSQDQCFLDGTCDDQTGECIPGDAAPENTECDFLGPGGGVCDGSGTCVECLMDSDCGAGEVCNEQNDCESGAVDPDPITRAVPVACANNLAPQLSDLLFALTVDPTTILAGQDFDAEITGVLQFDQAFLQAAIGFVPGLTSADVVGARASVGAKGDVENPLTPDINDGDNQKTVVPTPGSNCNTGTEPFCDLPIPQIENPGYPGTGQPCGGDTDCVFNALGATCVSNACTAAPTPLACDVDEDEDCPLYGVPSGYHPEVDGTGGQQCVANVCEEFACTGPGAIIPAGAECFAATDCSGANYGQTCNTTTFECDELNCEDGSCNVCTNIVTGGLAVPYGPTPGPRTFTAGPTVGGQICFDYGGNATTAGGPNLNLINVDAGGIAVALSCQGGTVDPDCEDTCPVDPANIFENAADPAILPCFDVQ